MYQKCTQRYPKGTKRYQKVLTYTHKYEQAPLGADRCKQVPACANRYGQVLTGAESVNWQVKRPTSDWSQFGRCNHKLEPADCWTSVCLSRCTAGRQDARGTAASKSAGYLLVGRWWWLGGEWWVVSGDWWMVSGEWWWLAGVCCFTS